MTINGGALRLANRSALVNASSLTLTGSGTSTGRLELSGGLTFTRTLSLPGRDSGNTAVHLGNYSGDNTLSSDIQLTGNSPNYGIESSSGLLSVTNIKNNSTATSTRILTLKGAGNGEVNGVIGGGTGTTPNNISLTKSDSGLWTLRNVNAYTGATTVNGGTLAVASTGSISSSSQFTVKQNATLDVSALVGGWSVANQQLAGSGTFKGAISSSASGYVTVAPGEVGTGGTLFFSSDLSLSSGAGNTLMFDLDQSPTSQRMIILMFPRGTSMPITLPRLPSTSQN